MVYEHIREYSDSLHESLLGKNVKTKINKTACAICLLITIILGSIGFLVYSLVCSGLLDDWPTFSLATTSIEGLSPSSQPSATISPVFNFTLHVDNSNNHHYRYCVEKGEAKVFYQMVQIATAPTLGFCVEGSGEKDVAVHAWDMELVLPAFLRDQLFEEVKKSKAVFDVQLMLGVSSDFQSKYISSIDCHMDVANAAMSRCKHSAIYAPYDAGCFGMRRHCGAAGAV